MFHLTIFPTAFCPHNLMDAELLTLLSLSSHGAAGRFRSEEVLCQQESLRSRKRRKERSDPPIITRKSEPAAIPLASAGFLSHQDWGKQGLRGEHSSMFDIPMAW